MHVLRSLQHAATVLDAIDSPLHDVRAALHLELARTDAANDFVTEAAARVAKALLEEHERADTIAREGTASDRPNLTGAPEISDLLNESPLTPLPS